MMFRSMCLCVPFLLIASETKIEQHFSVQTVKVTKQNSSVSASNYGYVKEDEASVHKVVPRYGGYVLELFADKIYMKVKKGQALVKVYSPKVFKAKDEYLNAYRYTKARPNKGKGMLESSHLKLELLGVPKDEIDRVISSNKTAKSTTIYSPINGYVFRKGISKGSAFKDKEELFTLVNLDEVWVEAKIYEEQREGLDKVEKYELSFKGLKERYESTNTLLYPRLDPKDATLTLRLRVKNDGKLFPGMYAKIASISKGGQGLVLPSTAVIRKSGRYYVFMVGEFKGEYEPREVEVQILDASRYVITKGLMENDEVVNNALFMMDSDAQISGLY